METKELIKKIVDNMELNTKKTNHTVRVDKATRAKVHEKFGNSMNRKICACILEFCLDEEIQKQCVKYMKNINFITKQDFKDKIMWFKMGKNIKPKIKRIMKKEDHNIAEYFFQGLMYIISEDLVEFKLPKINFISFEKISLKED